VCFEFSSIFGLILKTIDNNSKEFGKNKRKTYHSQGRTSGVPKEKTILTCVKMVFFLRKLN